MLCNNVAAHELDLMCVFAFCRRQQTLAESLGSIDRPRHLRPGLNPPVHVTTSIALTPGAGWQNSGQGQCSSHRALNPGRLGHHFRPGPCASAPATPSHQGIPLSEVGTRSGHPHTLPRAQGLQCPTIFSGKGRTCTAPASLRSALPHAPQLIPATARPVSMLPHTLEAQQCHKQPQHQQSGSYAVPCDGQLEQALDRGTMQQPHASARNRHMSAPSMHFHCRPYSLPHAGRAAPSDHPAFVASHEQGAAVDHMPVSSGMPPPLHVSVNRESWYKECHPQGKRINDKAMKLTCEQQEVVDRALAWDDYVLVMGLPGAGKTYTIAACVQV